MSAHKSYWKNDLCCTRTLTQCEQYARSHYRGTPGSPCLCTHGDETGSKVSHATTTIISSIVMHTLVRNDYSDIPRYWILGLPKTVPAYIYPAVHCSTAKYLAIIAQRSERGKISFPLLPKRTARSQISSVAVLLLVSSRCGSTSYQSPPLWASPILLDCSSQSSKCYYSSRGSDQKYYHFAQTLEVPPIAPTSPMPRIPWYSTRRLPCKGHQTLQECTGGSMNADSVCISPAVIYWFETSGYRFGDLIA